ncbi:hypothetical protein Tco_0035869, partial [Tanacetum coccineum]
ELDKPIPGKQRSFIRSFSAGAFPTRNFATFKDVFDRLFDTHLPVISLTQAYILASIPTASLKGGMLPQLG